MRDSPGGETAASEMLNPPATNMHTHTHVHSYAQTPTPGLIHCSIIPFPLYQKEREKETKEEGSEWRGWVGGEIACFRDFLPAHSRFCDPLSRTKSWNSLPSFLSKFKGKIESSLQNVKKDKLWRLGSHLVTGETQHCRYKHHVYEMCATEG